MNVLACNGVRRTSERAQEIARARKENYVHGIIIISHPHARYSLGSVAVRTRGCMNARASATFIRRAKYQPRCRGAITLSRRLNKISHVSFISRGAVTRRKSYNIPPAIARAQRERLHQPVPQLWPAPAFSAGAFSISTYRSCPVCPSQMLHQGSRPLSKVKIRPTVRGVTKLIKLYYLRAFEHKRLTNK